MKRRIQNSEFRIQSAVIEPGVILSAAKDLLAGIERRKRIIRCAQDDKSFRSLRNPEAPC